MNWRAAGCAVLAAAVFVGLGVWALLLALGRPGCPTTLVWGDRVYQSVGNPTELPVVGSGEPVKLGTTLVVALSRDIYGPEGSTPSEDADDRPDEIALDCGDGTFVSYRFATTLPTVLPSP